SGQALAREQCEGGATTVPPPHPVKRHRPPKRPVRSRPPAWHVGCSTGGWLLRCDPYPRRSPMNRLALALAAAILGTGCIVVDDDHPADCTRTVTVDWSFENADGGQTSDCTTAGVSALDVFVNGYF